MFGTMSNKTTPFKVGEVYPDQMGVGILILHIIEDMVVDWPVIGLTPEGRPRTYTFHGKFVGESGCRHDLIPPAPPMKRVPLGPEDVPPGSVVQTSKEGGWSIVRHVNPRGMKISAFHPWEELMDSGFQIKRPTDTGWQPMWKEAPKEGGAES